MALNQILGLHGGRRFPWNSQVRILEDDNLKTVKVPEICQRIKTRLIRSSERPDRTNVEMLGCNNFYLFLILSGFQILNL